MTTRAELFSELLEKEAFDTIVEFGFDRNDLAIEAMKKELDYSGEDLGETLLLLNAFTWNVIKATEKSFDSVKILSYMSQYLSETSHFMLSKKEEEEAIFYAGVVDIHEIRREAERRLDILEKILGKFEQVLEFDDEVFRLQNEENFYTYHIIRESYLFNAAFVDRRVDELPEIDQATFNVHKILGVDEDIIYESETDIAYTYGARDVENRTYRWGCCIASQSISFVYGPGNSNYDAKTKKAIRSANDFTVEEMILAAEDDLLLTILALYQRYTCMMLSETIQNRLRGEGSRQKTIRELKSEVLRFKSYDTITPFQISRWNNVCDTYSYLLEMNGVSEALDNVAENINLINEEMERIDNQRQDYFATVIAIFGLTSIVASVQQIADYLIQGEPVVRLWTQVSTLGLVVLGILYIIINRRQK